MPPAFFWDKNIDTSKYKDIFEKQGLQVSEEEIVAIIQNIDSIWSLFFDKYLQSIEKNED
jgi:hypothetical protein